jgi:hypothetical protein
MKGTCGKCTANMDPPLMSVVVTHLEHGSVMGYYCKAECMLEDTTLAIRHLIETNSLDDIPNEYLAEGMEPLLIEDTGSFDASKVIDIETLSGSRNPYYNARLYKRAHDAWTGICHFFDMARMTGVTDVTDEDGNVVDALMVVTKDWTKNIATGTVKSERNFLIPNHTATYKDGSSDMEFSLSYDDRHIFMTFPEGAYDVVINVTEYSTGIHQHLMGYVGLVRENIKGAKSLETNAEALSETEVLIAEAEVMVMDGGASPTFISEDVPEDSTM